MRSIPLERLPQVDMLRIFSRRPIMHGLFDADVTEARRMIKDEEVRTGERLSFTAFLVACLARAVDEDRGVQAFRSSGRRTMVFDEVDVATMVEVETGGGRVPVFRVVRDAAHLPVRQVHREIRGAQSATTGADLLRRRVARMRWIPRPLRGLLWRMLLRAPRTWKRYGGTVVLTSVGMFGNGSGWALSTSGGYPLGLTVGGIESRPALVGGTIEAREHVSLTLSFNHEVIDGAPAARFAARLKELIEHPASLMGTGVETSGGRASASA